MSKGYLDRNQQNNTDQNTTDISQKKIDPVAQLKWINNSSADQGFGIYGDNSMDNVEPEGKGGIRLIDNKNKTITVKAVFYVQTEKRDYFTVNAKRRFKNGYSAKQVNKMQTKYNKYLNNLGLNVTEGNLEGYSVRFNLQFVDGGTVDQCEESAHVLTEYGYSTGNSFTKGDGNTYHRFKTKEIDNGDGTVSNSTVGGITEDNQHITMNSSKDTKMNRLHEIFHTLGFSHPKGKGGKDGIMKYPPEKPNQNDINKIVYSDFLPNVFLN